MHQVSVFRTPAEIMFGPGVASDVGPTARRHGRRALVVTGAGSAKSSGALETVLRSLERAGVDGIVFARVKGEPTVAVVQEAVDLARQEGADLFIGLGGGSAIDAAKAAAGLFYSNRPVVAHFRGESVELERTLPWIALPTTAGAGAEVTPNAVLTDEETGIKQSIRSWAWLADAALVDPALTVSCPPAVTAHSGMDALVQAVESYTSRGATPLTEGISGAAFEQVVKGLLRAFENGQDLEARTAVAWGAMMSGVALANARLGAVHGFAHAVGTACGLPHGQVCAMLLPSVMEFNMATSEDKYATLARRAGIAAEGRSSSEAANDLLAFIVSMNERLGIPAKLGDVGLKEEMFGDIIAQTLPSGSLAANPRQAEEKDLAAILRGHLV